MSTTPIVNRRRPLTRVLMLLAILLSLGTLAVAGCEKKEEAAKEEEGGEGAAEGAAEGEGEAEGAGATDEASAGDMPERAEVAASAAPEINAEPITLSRSVPAVGTKRTKTKNEQMAMNIAVKMGDKSQTVPMKQKSKEVRVAEVLEVNDVGPSKLKVTYQAHSKVESAAGKEKTEAEPVEGKTYLVTAGADGARPTVTLEDGTEVSAEELEVVQKDFKRLGKKDPFEEVIPEGELTPDQELEVTPEAFTELLGGDEGMTVDAIKMTYKGTREVAGAKQAAFWVDMDFSGSPQPSMNMTGKMTGYFFVIPEGTWEAGADIRGDMDMTGNQGEQTMNAAGQMHIDETVEYAAP